MPQSEGSRDIDWRRDDITGIFSPMEITNEQHIISTFAGFSPTRYGFPLYEIPAPDGFQGDNSTLIKCTDLTTSTVLTRVTGRAPDSNEYFVSYETGRIYFNSAQNGHTVKVEYFGLGTVMNVLNTQFIETTILDTKVNRNGTLSMQGNLNLNSNKIVNLTNGSNANDAVNKSQLDGVKFFLNGSEQIFCKRISGGGGTSATVGHGIGSAFSSRRILAIFVDVSLSGSGYFYEISSLSYDDSNVYVTSSFNIDNIIILYK